MFYGIIARAQSMPIEEYHAVNDEVGRQLQGPPDGSLMHVARPIDDGFEVMEVWENQDKQETFMREVLEPAMKTCGHTKDELTWQSFEPLNLQVSQLSQDA